MEVAVGVVEARGRELETGENAGAMQQLFVGLPAQHHIFEVGLVFKVKQRLCLRIDFLRADVLDCVNFGPQVLGQT